MLKRILTATAFATLLSGCANGLSPVGVGLINKGDASIEAAKANGSISTVATADYHTKGFYPFYGKTCVNVTGQ